MRPLLPALLAGLAAASPALLAGLAAASPALLVDIADVPQPRPPNYIFASGYDSREAYNTSHLGCVPSPSTPVCLRCAAPQYVNMTGGSGYPVLRASCALQAATFTSAAVELTLFEGYYVVNYPTCWANLTYGFNFTYEIGCTIPQSYYGPQNDYLTVQIMSNSLEIVSTNQTFQSCLQLNLYYGYSQLLRVHGNATTSAEVKCIPYTNSPTTPTTLSPTPPTTRYPTYRPTPLPTFNPTTTLQNSKSVNFYTVPNPQTFALSAGTLFGAYSTTLQGCHVSANTPACLQCGSPYVSSVPYGFYVVEYYHYSLLANCSLVTQVLSTPMTPIIVFETTRSNFPCSNTSSLGAFLDFAYHIGCVLGDSYFQAPVDAFVGAQLPPGVPQLNSTDNSFASCMSNFFYEWQNGPMLTFSDASSNTVLCKAPTATPTPTTFPTYGPSPFPTFSPLTLAEEQVLMDFTGVPNPVVTSWGFADTSFGGYNVTNGDEHCTPSPATPGCLQCSHFYEMDYNYFSIETYYVMYINCSLRTQKVTTPLSSEMLLSFAIGPPAPCSALGDLSMLDAAVSFTAQLACMRESYPTTGDRLATVIIYPSTLVLTSSSNPAYAACLTANLSYIPNNYIGPQAIFTSNSDNLHCIASEVTQAPTPPTFRPTSSLELTYTVDLSTVSNPLYDFGIGNLFGAYTINSLQCTPSPATPACLRCGLAFLSQTYDSRHGGNINTISAFCHLETEQWTSDNASIKLFNTPANNGQLPCQWKASLGTHLSFDYTVGCNYGDDPDIVYGSPTLAVQTMNYSLQVNSSVSDYATCINANYAQAWLNPLFTKLVSASSVWILCKASTPGPTNFPTFSKQPSASLAPTTSSPTTPAAAVNVGLVAGAAGGGAAALLLLALAAWVLRGRRLRGSAANVTRGDSLRRGLGGEPTGGVATSNPKFNIQV